MMENETMNVFPADDERLQELVLHIAACCEDLERFDKALLGRMLFEADFLHFRRVGFPITGQTYVRGIQYPQPDHLAEVCASMIATGVLAVEEIPLEDGLHVRKRVRALRDAGLHLFDGPEIAEVEAVIRAYREALIDAERRPDETESLPDLSRVPWTLADLQEEIPYAAALVKFSSGARTSIPLSLELSA